MIKQTDGSVTVTDRADELMHYLYYIDGIDADWLGDTIKIGRLLEPRSLGRLGRIFEALDEIAQEAKTEGFSEVVEQAASLKAHMVKRIPYRIGLDLISKDPFERDLAYFRYEVGRWAEETGSVDEVRIISLASGYSFAVRDLFMMPYGAAMPCFTGHATFVRDRVERKVDIPPVIVSWEDKAPPPPPPPPLTPEDYGDPADLPF
jgi:hypothetical protein